MATYTVQPGDSLTGISVKLGLCKKGPGNTAADWAPCLETAREIQRLNPSIVNIDVIYPGQVLELPTGGSSTSWLWAALALLAGYAVYRSSK